MVEPISFWASLFYGALGIASVLKNALPRLKNAYQLRNLRFESGGNPQIRVNYGSHRLSKLPRDGVVIGGAVKLLQLQKHFPHRETGFNLAYLVSSALPPYAVDLVRGIKDQGCKLVWNQNGVAYPAWCGDFYPWFNRTMRELIHLADFVIYQSAFCKMSADRYLGKTQAPHQILFNPLDPEEFYPAEKPPDFSRYELLAIGTSHHFYRILSSLQTLEVLHKEWGISAHLTIAGKLNWRGAEAQVNRAIRQLKLRDHVTIFPSFTRLEARALYRKAHVLLHPKYKDPCPTVAIEAMAMGIPVVASNSGGMPELVPPTAGILVNVPDDWTRDHAPPPRELAAAIVKIMDNYAAYSTAAREHAVRTFHKDYWIQAHQAIFHDLLSGTIQPQALTEHFLTNSTP
ncbi:MAG: hypothetical protein C5B47_03415 [Verrucomicrobia bacterium]|nr:MAG: hypothetical protein C5B47_03415 [Verrucomicrobiota bacterium]